MFSAFSAAFLSELGDEGFPALFPRDDSGCLCTTMFRISPQHLRWALENLVEGDVVSQIKVKTT